MKTIWKYAIQPGENMIFIPEGAEFLNVHTEGRGVVCAWVRVDPGAPLTRRVVYTFATGHDIEGGWETAPYIGTFFVENLVFHLFDGGEEGVRGGKNA